MSEWLFWISLAGILYVYIGFPLVLLVRSIWRRPVHSSDISPRVSMVIVAHNEAGVIGEKLQNTLALDYPREQLEIVVASDGSDDGTDAIVAAYRAQGVQLLACRRRGKIPALNEAVSQTTGEILVFSDANSMYDDNALRALVRCFADQEVGGVAGNQCYARNTQGGAAGLGERMYWGFDRTLKSLQSRTGDIIGATGAIHAIRRELFVPVPLGVCDDFTISTGVIRQGRRLVFESTAIAREPVASTDTAEFRRKTRIAARGLRTMWVVRDLFNPRRHGFYAVQILSHKLLRWSVCWMLLVLLTASLLLAGEGGMFRWAAIGQLGFYGLAMVGLVMKDTPLARLRAYKLCAICYYFCLANTAAFCAWLQILRGRRVDIWNSQRQSATANLEGEAAA